MQLLKENHEVRDNKGQFLKINSVCKSEGCENKHHGLGFCLMHYSRLKRTGYMTIDMTKKTNRHNEKGHFLKGFSCWKNRHHSEASKLKMKLNNAKYFLENCLQTGKVVMSDIKHYTSG